VTGITDIDQWMCIDLGLCLFIILHFFICKPLQKNDFVLCYLGMQLHCSALEPNINSQLIYGCEQS